jgi:hypothetical protein
MKFARKTKIVLFFYLQYLFSPVIKVVPARQRVAALPTLSEMQ